MDDNLTVDELVSVYRKIRDAKNATEEAHKAEIGELNEQLEAISAKLLELCNAQNVDSLRTSSGTATRSTKTRYWTSDWEAMYQFIKENDAPYLLEQRIHNTNMKQFLEDHPDDLPVGLNADTKYTITVRKPTAK